MAPSACLSPVVTLALLLLITGFALGGEFIFSINLPYKSNIYISPSIFFFFFFFFFLSSSFLGVGAEGGGKGGGGERETLTDKENQTYIQIYSGSGVSASAVISFQILNFM